MGAGLALPSLLNAQTKPCPPPTLGVAGGSSVNTPCVASNAAGDWTTRSTGPGVVWAQRFTQLSDVQRFIIAADQTKAKSFVNFVANDGVLGDGCLSIDSPAGQGQYGSWGRPMRAITGDVNKAGLPVYATNIDSGTTATSVFSNMKGGFFGNAEYKSASPSDFVGTDYYLQFRVKFHPNRFNSNEPTGKMLMFVTGYSTPMQELVLQTRTDYGGRWYTMYTNTSTGFNSALNNPQSASGTNGSSLEPGGAYSSTCTQGIAPDGTNKCFLWPTNEWVTVLIHVIPGHQRALADMSNSSNKKDTGLEVWIARAGAKTYTKIWEKFDYVWEFGVSYLDGTPQPFGWNWINFTAFTGGAAAVPSVSGYYHRHDQLVFSTQFIPCPQA